VRGPRVEARHAAQQAACPTECCTARSAPALTDASLLTTPELHSKLCKKVAQLTKVIYHLNTRNEDSEGRLQLLQDDYEAEIENLLQDASAKVAAASEEGGGKAAAAAIAEKVAALEMWNVFRHGPGPLCRVFAWTFFHPTRAPN